MLLVFGAPALTHVVPWPTPPKVQIHRFSEYGLHLLKGHFVLRNACRRKKKGGNLFFRSGPQWSRGNFFKGLRTIVFSYGECHTNGQGDEGENLDKRAWVHPQTVGESYISPSPVVANSGTPERPHTYYPPPCASSARVLPGFHKACEKRYVCRVVTAKPEHKNRRPDPACHKQ